MPLAGGFSARVGSRPIILAAALMAFGAVAGSLDVAMNVHAIEVEQASGRPLMSGFHAMFSLGGFFGAAGLTVLLATFGVSPLTSALIGGLATLLLIGGTRSGVPGFTAGYPLVPTFPFGAV